MLEVKNVSKVYGKKDATFTALNNITLSIPAGKSVAIVGKSGSGKSTLMHIMSGLDRPTDGSVVFNGRDITTMQRKEVAQFRSQEMSFVFQAFFVEANRTCLDNVLLPLEIARASRHERIRVAEAALKAVGLADKKKSKARNLSGGQKQRLAVARAIVNRPSLLFADEPTGNLDSKTGEQIEKLLFALNKKIGSTLVIVTHDHDLASQCDMQVYLKDGKVVRTTQKRQKRTATQRKTTKPTRKQQSPTSSVKKRRRVGV